MLTKTEIVESVTELIVEHFGSLEEFVEAFPSVFEIVES